MSQRGSGAIVLAFTVTLCLIPEDRGSAQSGTRPNIVVIMADDFDSRSLATMVDKGMMPNLKSYLVDVGYEFVESFAVGTLGAPSRATFLTGQYPHNHGEIGSDPVLGEPPKFNERSTVATWLKNAGYVTGHVGRYVTGYGYATSPTYIPPGWDFWVGLVDPTTWSTSEYQMNIGGTVVDFAPFNTPEIVYHQTDVIAALAAYFVKSAPSSARPFFLMVTPTVFNKEYWPDVINACPDPSVPAYGGNYWGVTQRPTVRHLDTIYGDTLNFGLPMLPSFNEADVIDKPDWAQANPMLTPEDIDCLQKSYWRRLEGVRGVDDLVGAVMTSLEATGQLNNTVVIFTADNGLLSGEHRFPDKSPAYEEAVRVPLFVRTRNGIGPRKIDRMVMNLDLAPTIAYFGQATPTHTVDGRSLVPLLIDPEALPWRRIGLFPHVVRDTTFERFTAPPNYLAVRTASPTPRKYVRYPTVTTGLGGEYYDLAIDPYELDNLYSDPARQAEVQRLELWLNALKTCKGLGCYLLENYFSFN